MNDDKQMIFDALDSITKKLIPPELGRKKYIEGLHIYLQSFCGVHDNKTRLRLIDEWENKQDV